MGLYDYTYRLNPQAADEEPHNEVGGGHVLVGGTIALQNDAGDYYWRFSDGLASVAGPSHSVVATVAGGGVTIAARMRVTTYPSGSTTGFMGYSTDTTVINRFGFGNNSGSWRGSYQGSVHVTGMADPGSAWVTVILRATMSATGGADQLHLWYSTSGNSGDAPDLSSSTLNLSNQVFDTLLVNAAEGSVIDISDWVVWPEELSNAACASIRNDGIDTVLDSTPSTTVQFGAFLPSLQWSGLVDVGGTQVNFAADLPALQWAGAVALSDPPGTLTSRRFRNGAFLPLNSGSIPHVLVANLDLTAATRFTAQSYDASGHWTIQAYPVITGNSYVVLYSNGAGIIGAEVLTAT